MNYNIKNIGSGSPKVAIVGVVHGDEIIGKKVIQALKDIKLKRGSLSFIIANLPALKKHKRYLSQDLNRSFPGKANAKNESRLAYHLAKELKKYDLVIDIHATNSNIDSLVIVTSFGDKIKKLLKKTSINKIAIASKKVFGLKSLIANTKLGISLEYGPNKSGRNYTKALRDVKIILQNLNLLVGKRQNFYAKIIYRVFDIYKVNKNFKQSDKLRDFHLIKKDDIIGMVGKREIKSKKNFYPLFLGEGRYANTLALMAHKKDLKL